MADEPKAAPKPTKKAKRKTGPIETLIWRTCAALPWLWFCVTVAAQLLGFRETPGLGLACFLPPIFAAILYFRLGFIGAAEFLLYAATFPFIAAYFVYFSSRSYMKFARRALALVTSLPAMAVYLLLLFACWPIMVIGQVEWMRYLSVITAQSLVTLVLICLARVAANPLNFLGLFDAILPELEKKPEGLLTPKTDDEINDLKKAKSRVDISQFMLEWTTKSAKFVEWLATESLVVISTLIFIVAYFVVVVTFALCIMTLQASKPTAFNGMDASFGSALAYSTTIISTSPLPNVVPNTAHGTWLYTHELFCTFLLISVLFSLIGTGLSMHGEARINRARTTLAKIKPILEKELALHTKTMEEQQAKSEGMQPGKPDKPLENGLRPD